MWHAAQKTELAHLCEQEDCSASDSRSRRRYGCEPQVLSDHAGESGPWSNGRTGKKSNGPHTHKKQTHKDHKGLECLLYWHWHHPLVTLHFHLVFDWLQWSYDIVVEQLGCERNCLEEEMRLVNIILHFYTKLQWLYFRQIISPKPCAFSNILVACVMGLYVVFLKPGLSNGLVFSTEGWLGTLTGPCFKDTGFFSSFLSCWSFSSLSLLSSPFMVTWGFSSLSFTLGFSLLLMQYVSFGWISLSIPWFVLLSNIIWKDNMESKKSDAVWMHPLRFLTGIIDFQTLQTHPHLVKFVAILDHR